MNKRISTLLGASLLLSSAFSVVSAKNLSEAEKDIAYRIVRSSQTTPASSGAFLDAYTSKMYLSLSKDGKLTLSTSSVNEKGSFWYVEKVVGVADAYKLKNLNGDYLVTEDGQDIFYSKEFKSTYGVTTSADNAFSISTTSNATNHLLLDYTAGKEDAYNPVGWGIDNGNYSLLFNLEDAVDIDRTALQIAEKMNSVNEGSFSIDYRFNDDEVAEVNPFSVEVKAFAYNDKVYFATEWPASLNKEDKISSEAEFNKCTFIVADYEDRWNISDLRLNGEGAKFTEIEGKYLLSSATVNDLKAGRFARENAAFDVTFNPVNDKFSLKLESVKYLNADEDDFVKNEDTNGDPTPLHIGLIDDEAGLIVTTITNPSADKIDKCQIEGTITNNRTVSVDKIISTDKASVFNIKFLSQNAVPSAKEDVWTSKEKATYSEYNKYLGIKDNNDFLAQGADFVDLNAPENQWIIVDADSDDKTVKFQNRENDNISFTASLVETEKDNVYEIRLVSSTSAGVNYGFVNKKGEYELANTSTISGVNILSSLHNSTIELTSVTPETEAGYVSSELDNAGLIRFSFTANEYNNALVDELFVTANEDNEVSVDKEEASAAQFSVIKYDAASTSTALADTLYADNDYVIWDAANKKVKKIVDGDTIAVVSYAFKQLRADGENYYLSADMENVEKQNDESKAPRFLVKVNKNGSYSLISVNRTADDFREVVTTNSKTFDLNTNSSSAPITSNVASIYYEYATREFDFNILKETPGTSYNHVPQHVTMESVNGGYIAMNAENNNGIIAPVSTLKADYTKEDLTFWLDTTDSEAVTPSFMISKAGNYMYNATDSLNRYNGGTASEEKVKEFALNVNGEDQARVIFQSADLAKVKDIENYKFQIVQSPESEEEYIIKSLNGYTYVAAHNQQLYISGNADAALRLIVTPAEAPTSNEGVSANEVKVVAQDGAVVVKNAAGKNVVVSTILGQVVANEVLTSDNATINVPAGIVVVAVEGESFKVNVK